MKSNIWSILVMKIPTPKKVVLYGVHSSVVFVQIQCYYNYNCPLASINTAGYKKKKIIHHHGFSHPSAPTRRHRPYPSPSAQLVFMQTKETKQTKANLRFQHTSKSRPLSCSGVATRTEQSPPGVLPCSPMGDPWHCA